MERRGVPNRGDIVVASLEPALGHERGGVRPLLVISHHDFNAKTGLAVICPITTKARGNLFEVPVSSKQTSGVILAHQIRTIDLRSRKTRVKDRVSDDCLQTVVGKVGLLINL